LSWMGARAVDWARLESVCTARYRGFESLPIRQWFIISDLQNNEINKKRCYITDNTTHFFSSAQN
jgi:hypothetical protein